MAMARLAQTLKLQSLAFQTVRAVGSGNVGSGQGKGGGGGGTIRTAGGAFGEMEAAREEEYFRKLQAQQIKALHDHIEDEVHHQQSEINRLSEELKRKQMKLDRLKDELKKD